MSDNRAAPKELFDLLFQYAESHNLGGTLQILDTLLHLLEMVVKDYTEKNAHNQEERLLQQARAKEIVFASKKAIGEIIKHCDSMPTTQVVEKKLLGTLPVGVCVTDVLGRIHYANPKFLDITGLTEKEAQSLNIATLYSDANKRKQIIAEMKAAATHEEIKTFKIPLKKQQQEYLVESIQRNIEWEGKKNCMVAVIIERTDAKNVEQIMEKVAYGDVTMEQMLKTVSARAKEKQLEEARRKKAEKEKQLLQGFADSLVNMVGNIIYLEDNMVGKDIYTDRLYRATNVSLFAILVLNAFEPEMLQHIFGKKSHPKTTDHIKRELLYGITLHDIGKIGVTAKHLLDETPFDDEQKKQITKEHIVIGANLLKDLKGPFSETIKIMGMYHHKTRDGNPGGYPDGEENRLADPRELLAKWFDVFYSFVTKRPYRKELLTYEQITLEHMFKAPDLCLQPQASSPLPYPEKMQLLLKNLHAIFTPTTTDPKYKKIQEEIKKWMGRIRHEQENAHKRIWLKNRKREASN